MKTKISVEETFNECRKLCNHILKLSKINNPNLWKKCGKPHIAIWADLKNKKYDSFRIAFSTSSSSETSVHFSVSDVKMSIKQFKEKCQKHSKHLKKLGIYKKN